MQATKTKPKTQPRTCRWLSRQGYGTGYIRITRQVSSKKTEVNIYAVKHMAEADFGPAFTVVKLRLDAEGKATGEEEATYHVNLDGHGSCDCPGGTYCSTCKHLECVRMLHDTNRL